MFTGFHSMLRAAGLQVGVGEWMAVVDALDNGAIGPNMRQFYTVARALVCRDEGDYDRFDQAFGAFFQGTALPTPLTQNLHDWLDNPLQRPALSAEELDAMQHYDLDQLRKLYEERLAEQTERHDGGSNWIGTGGTSPFGQGGNHPTGMRVGEGAQGRGQAIATAKARRFRNYRSDMILDTRQIAVAIRKLRRLERKARRLELDIDATIDQTARNCGDITIVQRPERRNQARVVLLLDAGGSMDPHARTVEAFFSALKQSGGLREVEVYYFHNCPYGELYTDMAMFEKKPIADVLRSVPPNTYLVAVGDAWMAPRELLSPYGAIEYGMADEVPGLTRIEQIAAAFPQRAWLNPIPENYWGETTIAAVAAAVPMFPLTVDGMVRAVSALMGKADKRAQPPAPVRRNPWAAATTGFDA